MYIIENYLYIVNTCEKLQNVQYKDISRIGHIHIKFGIIYEVHKWIYYKYIYILMY